MQLPDFDLSLTDGQRMTKKDLLGKRTVLYFYPKDDTPGCTIEAKDFTALLPEFQRRSVQVIGVSPDSVSSHEQFTQKCNIGFPLISDPDASLCQAMGVWVEKWVLLKKYMGVERSTFLIAPDGTVEREWRKVSANGHAREVLNTL